jgi:hypothetical protein
VLHSEWLSPADLQPVGVPSSCPDWKRRNITVGLKTVNHMRVAGDVHQHELLAMLGVFGCLWSAAQGLPLELGTLTAAHLSAASLAPFLGFGAAMFAFYSLVPLELQWGGAALLNISLLASDVWAAMARYFYFGAPAAPGLQPREACQSDVPESPWSSSCCLVTTRHRCLLLSCMCRRVFGQQPAVLSRGAAHRGPGDRALHSCRRC